MRHPSIVLVGIALAVATSACAANETQEPVQDPMAAPSTPVPTTEPTAAGTTAEPTATPDPTPEDEDEGSPPPQARVDAATALLEFNNELLTTTEAVDCTPDGDGFAIIQGDPASDDEFLTITMPARDATSVEAIDMVKDGWMFAVDPPNGRGSAAVSATGDGYEFAGEGEVRHVDDQETLEEVAYTLTVTCT